MPGAKDKEEGIRRRNVPESRSSEGSEAGNGGGDAPARAPTIGRVIRRGGGGRNASNPVAQARRPARTGATGDDDDDGEGIVVTEAQKTIFQAVLMVMALPAFFIFYTAYNNINIPSPHLRPWHTYQVRETDFTIHDEVVLVDHALVGWGDARACDPVRNIARVALMGGARVRVLCPEGARAAFSGLEASFGSNFTFRAYAADLAAEMASEVDAIAAGGGFLDQIAFGGVHTTADGFARLVDTWTDFARGSGAFWGPSLPWTTHAVNAVSDALGIAPLLIAPGPGHLAAGEFAVSPLDHRDGLVDLGHPLINYYYGRTLQVAAALLGGLRGATNAWRAAHGEATYWIGEANGPGAIARVPIVSPWCGSLLRGPVDGYPRFTRVYTDLSIHDGLKWHLAGMPAREGPAAFRDASPVSAVVAAAEPLAGGYPAAQAAKAADAAGSGAPVAAATGTAGAAAEDVAPVRVAVVHVDLPHATASETAAVRDGVADALRASGVAAGTVDFVVRSGTAEPAGGWGGSSVVVDDTEHEALLRSAVLTVHNGYSLSVSGAVRAGVPQLSLPHWITSWTTVIREKKIGAAINDRAAWSDRAAVATAVRAAVADETWLGCKALVDRMRSREGGAVEIAVLINNLFGHIGTKEMRDRRKEARALAEDPDAMYGAGR